MDLPVRQGPRASGLPGRPCGLENPRPFTDPPFLAIAMDIARPDQDDLQRNCRAENAPDSAGVEPAHPPLILILCTGNSCRSHLAEGFLRAALMGKLRVASAGSKPAGFVHPFAIRAMSEIGIDISGHRPKHLDEFLNQEVETVITVCGNADQACPMFPGQVNRHHWGFDDPAHATGSDEEKMAVFRRVRDEIRRVFEAYAAGRLDALRQVSVRS